MTAPTPLFQSYAALRGVVRLSGVKDGTDPELQLQAAVRESWTVFWRGLSSARVATLQSYAHVEPPVTENDFLRLLAETVEQKIVRRALLVAFGNAFKEGASATVEAWNREGFVRSISAATFDRERAQLDSEIAEGFATLSGDVPAGEATLQISSPVSADVQANGPLAVGAGLFGREGIFGSQTLRSGS